MPEKGQKEQQRGTINLHTEREAIRISILALGDVLLGTPKTERDPPKLRRQTIAHLELHQSVVLAHTFNAALPK